MHVGLTVALTSSMTVTFLNSMIEEAALMKHETCWTWCEDFLQLDLGLKRDLECWFGAAENELAFWMKIFKWHNLDLYVPSIILYEFMSYGDARGCESTTTAVRSIKTSSIRDFAKTFFIANQSYWPSSSDSTISLQALLMAIEIKLIVAKQCKSAH